MIGRRRTREPDDGRGDPPEEVTPHRVLNHRDVHQTGDDGGQQTTQRDQARCITNGWCPEDSRRCRDDGASDRGDSLPSAGDLLQLQGHQFTTSKSALTGSSSFTPGAPNVIVFLGPCRRASFGSSAHTTYFPGASRRVVGELKLGNGSPFVRRTASGALRYMTFHCDTSSLDFSLFIHVRTVNGMSAAMP